MGNIFNIDETGLFWKLLPERTLQFKGIDCKGGKHAKDRITILVGASALGEKLPLMVIGKSQKKKKKTCLKKNMLEKNCFKHVGFIHSGDNFVFEEDTTSIILKDSLSQQHYPNTDLDKYLEADYHLYTTEVVTEDSIVHDILGDNTLTDDSDDEIIDVIHEVKPTR